MLAATVFSVETLVMLVLPHLPPMSDLAATLLDATSLVVMIFPVLYMLVFRPTSKHIEKLSQLEELRRKNEASLRTLLDNLPYRVWLKDPDGYFLALNENFAQAYSELKPEDIVGRKDVDVLPPALAAHCRNSDLEVMNSRQHKYLEEKIVEHDEEKWMETFRAPILDSDGRLLGTTGFSRDITERKRVEDALLLAASIYRSSGEGIMVTDEHNNIVEVNPAFSRITGYSPEEVLGKNPRMLQSGRQSPEFYREMWHTLFAQDHWQGEIWNRRKNGDLFAQWATLSLIRDQHGKVHRHVAQFSDITDKKLKDDLIWKQANFDVLTGLPNRRLFLDRLEQEMRKAHRNGQPLALMFIDLDRFKEVNDTLGHAQGDQLLVEAAQRILGCVRESDTVARLGGDEFTVVLPEFRNPLHVERIAQDIITRLSKPFSLGSEEIGNISASIGITLFPNDATDLDGLLRHADQAMYAAKSEGRNRFSYFTESMQRAAREKLLLGNDLRHALARGQLEIHYQPIVELVNKRIVKAEALLRWHHPQRGLVGPAVFIPLAEELGLIPEIGSWVFREAIACVERWYKQFGVLLPVSVNKSPAQFTEKTGTDGWLSMLAEIGLPGAGITVEITEGLLLNESPSVQQRLLEFRNNGIEVSIDDFGTGFSSLSYLKRFHIDYLKIDRAFISNLTSEESDKALTEAIIVMAHKLGIKTVAEGVETDEQLELLRGFGCDYAQGYLLAPPLPEPEFRNLLDKQYNGNG